MTSSLFACYLHRHHLWDHCIYGNVLYQQWKNYLSYCHPRGMVKTRWWHFCELTLLESKQCAIGQWCTKKRILTPLCVVIYHWWIVSFVQCKCNFWNIFLTFHLCTQFDNERRELFNPQASDLFWIPFLPYLLYYCTWVVVVIVFDVFCFNDLEKENNLIELSDLIRTTLMDIQAKSLSSTSLTVEEKVERSLHLVHDDLPVFISVYRYSTHTHTPIHSWTVNQIISFSCQLALLESTTCDIWQWCTNKRT